MKSTVRTKQFFDENPVEPRTDTENTKTTRFRHGTKTTGFLGWPTVTNIAYAARSVAVAQLGLYFPGRDYTYYRIAAYHRQCRIQGEETSRDILITNGYVSESRLYNTVT